MDTQRLSYFCEVIRLGGFTAAARKLRLSQPALSKAVRALEEELGMTLVVRGRRGRGRTGVRPTTAGKALFLEGERILGELAGIEGRLKSVGAQHAGILMLGASDNFSNYLLPRIWSRFLAKHPSSELTLFCGTSEAIQAEVLARRIELGLSYHASDHARLRCEKVAEVEFAAVSAKPLQARDLKAVPFIGSIAEDYRRPYAALRILRELGVSPRRLIQVNQQEVQKSMALQGLGYTVVPKFMVSASLQSGELRVVPTPHRPRVPLFLSYRDRAPLSPLAESFREHLIGHISGLL